MMTSVERADEAIDILIAALGQAGGEAQTTPQKS